MAVFTLFSVTFTYRLATLTDPVLPVRRNLALSASPADANVVPSGHSGLPPSVRDYDLIIVVFWTIVGRFLPF